MEFLNTANPIVILFYTLVISVIIFLGRKTERPGILILLNVYILVMLIMHTSGGIATKFTSSKYISIVFDLIFLFLSFFSYLWVDDINAKNKKLKDYDNSLSWFWDKL